MPCPVANKHNKTNTIMTTEQIKLALDEHAKWLRGGSDSVRANLSGAYLSGADLNGADLCGAYLSGANLSGANLNGADLNGAYLRGANLSGANLIGAYLSGAYLSGSDLCRADLCRANLNGANLNGAYLRGANLSGANLIGAYLSGAYLSGADLAQVHGLRVADCQWSAHGEWGRRLLAVELPTGLHFYCGCFNGDETSLRGYINAKDPKRRASRLKALDFLLSCF